MGNSAVYNSRVAAKRAGNLQILGKYEVRSQSQTSKSIRLRLPEPWEKEIRRSGIGNARCDSRSESARAGWGGFVHFTRSVGRGERVRGRPPAMVGRSHWSHARGTRRRRGCVVLVCAAFVLAPRAAMAGDVSPFAGVVDVSVLALVAYLAALGNERAASKARASKTRDGSPPRTRRGRR